MPLKINPAYFDLKSSSKEVQKQVRTGGPY